MLAVILAFLAISGERAFANPFGFKLPPGVNPLRENNLSETTDAEFIQKMDLLHEIIRDAHDVPSLALNEKVVDYARIKAIALAWNNGNLPQAGGSLQFGENRYVSDHTPDILEIFKAWYTQEEKDFDYENPVVKESTANFTQLIWKDTVSYGCGQAVQLEPSFRSYTVCLYDPAGNIPDEAKENINPQTNRGEKLETAIKRQLNIA